VQTKNSLDCFLSHAPYLLNVKDMQGQDSLWDFLIRYVQQFYVSVKEHNKGGAIRKAANEGDMTAPGEEEAKT